MASVTGIFRFEQIDERLVLLPLSARRALDVAGRRLSLAAWLTLSVSQRQLLVAQGSNPKVDVATVHAAIRDARPPAKPIEPDDENRLEEPGAALLDAVTAIFGEGALDARTWSSLGKLDRFALKHLAIRNRSGHIEAAYREIVGACGTPGKAYLKAGSAAAAGSAATTLTHLSPEGDACMVDVGEKPITCRRAIAQAVVHMTPETAQKVVDHSGPKGDVLATARLAAIMAAKRTPDLIPLCHGVALTRVTIHFDINVEMGIVKIKAAIDARDRTGVEMEALVAANIAALTIYDMLKAVERGIRIEAVYLLEKSGGRSGHYRHDPSERRP